MGARGGEEFDYVIVGSGSAGAVLANRLSADPSLRVLLLEAGGRDHAWDWRIHMPAALSYPMNSRRYDWGFRTVPQPGLNNRVFHAARGRVLGGTSSINGMVFVRGNPGDYTHWAETAQAPEWRYEACLPYFKRMETAMRGANAWRGGDGPLRVSTGAADNPLAQAWLAAGQQAGYPFTDDYNGESQDGVCRFDMTVHAGRRQSTARTYLHPVMGRPNLTVRTGALVARVELEGARATGVAYRWRGTARIAHAAREVLLAAGAFGSPHLLMLSGIGPADHLRAAGVPVRHDLPGVGENLQDHLEVYFQHACTQPVSLYGLMNPVSKALVGLRWLARQDGPGATTHFESGAFLRSGPEVDYPDIQYHFLPLAVRYDGAAGVQGHGFQAHVGPMRSASRGVLRLASADPAAAPVIDFRYLSAESDRAEWRRAIRMTREIFAQKAFDPYRGAELAPGPECRTDADIDAFVAAHAESAYHPCGTCKMGNDAMAVVDARLRVRGIEALRVIDSSIFPRVTNGNLNAPSIMVGERGADFVLGREAPSA